MGQSTNAMLVYGYDLGGDDSGWKVREASEYGTLITEWYDGEAEDGDDLQTAAETRLLASVGFTETDWSAEGFYARQKEATARLGVEFDTYCSGSCPMFVLATKVITVYRGDIEEIDMAELGAAPAREGWDDKLRTALAALGLTPVQERARWLLCSYWG